MGIFCIGVAISLIPLVIVISWFTAQGSGDCDICRGHIDQRNICMRCGNPSTSQILKELQHDRN